MKSNLASRGILGCSPFSQKSINVTVLVFNATELSANVILLSWFFLPVNLKDVLLYLWNLGKIHLGIEFGENLQDRY